MTPAATLTLDRRRAALHTAASAVVTLALATAAYAIVGQGLGGLAGAQPGNLGLAVVATGVAAAMVPTMRARAGRAVDHALYGARADAIDHLERYASSLATALDVDSILPRTAETARELVNARHAELHLYLPTGDDRIVVWPPGSTSDELDRVIEVRHDGTTIGRIAVAMHQGDQLSPADEARLERLAQAAAIALDNARLTLALRAQVEEIEAVTAELQASSARIVTAAEAEQRRIERAIRAEVERPLRAITARLRTTHAVLHRSPRKAAQLVAACAADGHTALAALRTVAHGLFPPLLDAAGVGAALRGQADRGGWNLSVESAAEATAASIDAKAITYFAVTALAQLAASHAPGEAIVVTLDVAQEAAVTTLAGPAIEALVSDDLLVHDEVRRTFDRVEAVGGQVITLRNLGPAPRVIVRVPLHPPR